MYQIAAAVHVLIRVLHKLMPVCFEHVVTLSANTLYQAHTALARCKAAR